MLALTLPVIVVRLRHTTARWRESEREAGAVVSGDAAWIDEPMSERARR